MSHNKQGFTLIELMVVITIIGVLFAGSYVPYDYYSRLSKVRISSEKVRQTMEEARILAQNGQVFPGTSKNANIGVVFQKGSRTINMFAYMSGTHSFNELPNQAKIIKTISLEDGININNLPADKIMIEYSAPRGVMEIYTNPAGTPPSKLDIGIGWKTATTGTLYRTISVEK